MILGNKMLLNESNISDTIVLQSKPMFESLVPCK